MPCPDRPRLKHLLATGAIILKCPLTDHQIGQFLDYLVDLYEWNQRVNLTAITEDEDVIEKHFLDSLAGLNVIKERAGYDLLDIGAGAGFPGIPLKIGFPKLRLSLVEASRKKSAFLHHMIGRLRLTETTVLNRRVEDLPDMGVQYDWIVVRAFAKTEVVLDMALSLLSPKGRLILYQGRTQTGESVQANRGWEATIPYELPFSKIPRRLEIFRPLSS